MVAVDTAVRHHYRSDCERNAEPPLGSEVAEVTSGFKAKS